MKLFMILAFVTIAFARPDDMDKYNDLDVDSLIGNKRLLTAFLRCLSDKGPCTPDAAYIKSNMKEAIQTSCAKCSENQKYLIAKSLKAGKEEVPAEFDEIFHLYSEGKEQEYELKLNAFIEKYTS